MRESKLKDLHTIMDKIFVTRPFLPDRKNFDTLIDQIWEADWLTNNGPLHENFSSELKSFLSVPNVTLTTNGHLALDIAIKGLGIKGEVITTPFTFASTTHALVLNNIKPVFADIVENNLTIDPTKLESLITSKTSAILPVHVYGHPCNTEEIMRVAQKYDLKIIYDAAHAFGVKKNGKSITLEGDVSMLSFHATKLFHSIEGGALVYKNEKYRKLFNMYKNFGIEGEESINYVGENAKMNEFQCAMGLANLPYVNKNILERKKITFSYRLFLSKIPGITFFTPESDNSIDYNYSYMPILIDSQIFGHSRDDVYSYLKSKNIYSRKYFYPLVTDFGCYINQFKDSYIPVAKKISSQILCLPIYNGLPLESVERICSYLYDFYMES